MEQEQTQEEEEKEELPLVGNTILQQLGGTGKLVLMIGAHSFCVSDTSATFKWKARSLNGLKSIRVTLDPSDTYIVEFFLGRTGALTSKHSDVYCEDLIPLFERVTGLYLRF